MFKNAFIIASFVLLAGCGQVLRDGLDESQANDILALLRQQGLNPEKKRDSSGSWRIELQASEKQSADQLMHKYEVPRDARQSMLDIFPGGGLMPSESEESIRYQQGLSEELTKTLEKMDGVLSARVHVALPQDTRKKIHSSVSASAFIRYRSDVRLDLLKPQIRALIAAGVPGAKADAITLLMIPVYPVVHSDSDIQVRSWMGIEYRLTDRPLAMLVLFLPWLGLLLVVLHRLGHLRLAEWFKASVSTLFNRRASMGGTWSTKGFSPAARSAKPSAEAAVASPAQRDAP